MKTLLLQFVAVTLLLVGSIAHDANGDPTAPKSGDLTIPWDEFKGLLNLDKDQIVIPYEIFQKLLSQTGAPIPPHSVSGGMVVLTQNEFSNLVGKMKPPTSTTDPPPFDYLTTKAHYKGEMQDVGTSFTGRFVVHVLKNDSFVKVPVLPVSMALENVTVNGKQSLVVAENGSHNVIITGAGEYEVAVSFSVMSKLADGPGRIDLAILPTPITLLTLSIPLAGIEIDIPQSQKVSTQSVDSTTRVSAVVAQGRGISIMWKKALTPTEKIPSKLYSETNYLVSIEDDALSVDIDINLNILHSEIKEIQLELPDGINILSIVGQSIGDWHEITDDGTRRIVIPFTYGVKGTTVLRLLAEAPLNESGLANSLSGIRVLGVVRETGSIGIELNTSAEVTIVSNDGVEPVAVQKLPMQLINKSKKPLMFGFKYLKHPFGLVLDIKKHRKVAVPVATINTASAVSLFTEDGKIVHRLVYQVRNNAKQFLEFQLPKSADVWSVFVNGNPVESSMDDDEKLLVPLIRSQAAGNGLDTFPVEIIYCVVDNRFSFTGMRESMLPAVDLLISQLIWSVYLPNDYSYLHFNSTLEIEEMIRGINILSNETRLYDEIAMRKLSLLAPDDAARQDVDRLREAYEGKKYESDFRNVQLERAQIVGQLNAEMEFGGRLEEMADMPSSVVAGTGTGIGVLPIQIRIPTGGQVYRFARTIIRPDDPLTVSVTYGRNWLISAAKWLFGFLLLLVLYVNRRRFIEPLRRIGRTIDSLWTIVNEHRESIAKAVRSPMAIVVLAGLLVLAWVISPIVSLPVLLALWICVAYQVIEYWKKRSARKSASGGKMSQQRV